DTSAFIAALDRSDSHHRLYARLFSSPPALLTSSLVVAEGHGGFLRRYDQHKAIQFLNFIQELTPLSIVPFGQEDVDKVSGIVKKLGDQKGNFPDTHGLVIMRDRRIKFCWSTDRHLGLTGVRLVM